MNAGRESLSAEQNFEEPSCLQNRRSDYMRYMKFYRKLVYHKRQEISFNDCWAFFFRIHSINCHVMMIFVGLSLMLLIRVYLTTVSQFRLCCS